jgi:hypothetical protein
VGTRGGPHAAWGAHRFKEHTPGGAGAGASPGVVGVVVFGTLKTLRFFVFVFGGGFWAILVLPFGRGTYVVFCYRARGWVVFVGVTWCTSCCVG